MKMSPVRAGVVVWDGLRTATDWRVRRTIMMMSVRQFATTLTVWIIRK